MTLQMTLQSHIYNLAYLTYTPPKLEMPLTYSPGEFKLSLNTCFFTYAQQEHLSSYSPVFNECRNTHTIENVYF